MFNSFSTLIMRASRVDPVFQLGVALAVVGALPHLLFSLWRGECVFFLGAWDEDTYGLWAVQEEWGNATHQGLFLSTQLLKGLYAIAGNSFAGMHMLADVILPLMALAACCYCVRPMFDKPLHIALASASLLLGSEVLSFSSLVLPPWGLNMPLLIQLAPKGMEVFLVDNRYTFLFLFRTPEPQFSIIMLILAAGATLRVLQEEHRASCSTWCLLLACLALGGGFYTATWAIAVIIATSSFLALAICSRYRLAITGLSAVTLTCLLSWGLWFVAADESSTTRSIFESHAPLLSVSVLLSFCLSGTLCWFGLRSECRNPWFWGSLATLSVPVVTLNQQVITGLMIMPQVWEKAGNYSALILGILMATKIESLRRTIPICLFSERVQKAVLYSAFAVLLSANVLSAGARLPLNEHAALQEEAFMKVSSQSWTGFNDELSVILSSNHDTLFRIRTENSASVIGGYEALLLGDEDQSFQWLDRQGIEPRELRETLEWSVAEKQGYPWLMMFYRPLDVWWAFSNGRATIYDKVSSEIPLIVQKYSRWLERNDPADLGAAVFLSDKELPQLLHGNRWENTLLTVQQSPLPFVNPVYAYIQRPLHEGMDTFPSTTHRRERGR